MRKIVFVFLIGLVFACGSDEPDTPSNGDDFDRKEMLTFWADKMIIPSYTDFQQKTSKLKASIRDFVSTPNQENLTIARASFKLAYISWQKVSLFQIGKAKSNAMTSIMNTYPTDITKLKKYVIKDDYTLDSPNLYKIQGFPAVDYLLYGVAEENQILDFYNEASNAPYKIFLTKVTDKMHNATQQVLDSWKGDYRETFISKDGYTTTSSVDKMVNYYVVTFYEKQFRENKIATPAGVRIDRPVPNTVEAYYAKNLSKELYLTTLEAVKNFYLGIAYDGTQGISLHQYLLYLKRDDLAQATKLDFDNLTKISNNLDDSFIIDFEVNEDQKVIIKDRQKRSNMFAVYDAIQLILKQRFKPDMMSALSVQNSSADSDND